MAGWTVSITVGAIEAKYFNRRRSSLAVSRERTNDGLAAQVPPSCNDEMPTVDRVSQVAGELERMILSSQLAPGALLPPERELGATMGVSRSVVREALGRLESLGLVNS